MVDRLTRRSLLHHLLGAGITALTAFPLRAGSLPQNGQRSTDGLTGRDRGEMGRLVWGFNKQFAVPASSIAISRKGQFVYDRAFGMMDRSKALQAEQSSIFRIASVSKPITSVTIFSLLEQHKLNLNDKVFGPSGILGTKFGKGPYKQYVTDVTVDHLLTHTSGGWPNDSTDPMFQHDSWDHQKLISWTIENLPLTYPPGQHWAYSNFGY